MTETARLRVLVSAYACGPDRGSEPGVGWNAVREIARDHEVVVITSHEHKAAIEETVAREGLAARFIFVDWPPWLDFIKRTRVGFELQQYAWQLAAYLHARRLHAQIRFDVAHHVTVCRYWMPSFLPFLGIPFVWGPVGGGESAPTAFWPGLGVHDGLLEVVRAIARWVGERDPLLRLSARRTSLGVATTHETCSRMKRLAVPRLEVCTQVALTEREIAALGECQPRSEGGGIRFISIARLVPWKGIHLGLRAFARLQDRLAEYWIVGGGPAESSLKTLAAALGVADRVRFLGQKSRAEVLQILQQCDVLVHPSLHDSGGVVCAEVMAAGRPVICLDLGGPSLQVTADTGIVVPARGPQQVIADMAVAMDALSGSPSRRAAMGHAARARVQERFNTSALRQHFNRWYREVVVRDHRHADQTAVSTAVTAREAHPSPPVSHTKASPVVSAVMSTYNKGPWLQQAIDSVLQQTFTDWELIIVDDGSTDDSATVLAACTDPRITIYSLSNNVGRAKARNVALERARGRYIAICDSDDVSAATRFERHVSFLDSHPEVGVVSGYIRQLSDRHAARIAFPLDHESIARRFARGKMGAAHGAAMIRSVCFEQLGLYLDDLRSAEDFELFRRFCQRFEFRTLPEELLLYRSRLGTVPLREWAELSRAHRYALYRSNLHNSTAPVLSFDEFVHSWRTNVAVYTVDSLRFAHFNLRAHVFSSHVLR